VDFLIGPKLYEANWIDLQDRGYLARVQCIEVWCEMTSEFYKEYFNARGNYKLKEALYFNNPNKYMSCDYLVRLHKSRGDKIIIFCDHIFSLKEYAERLKIPMIYGKVGDKERLNIISHFRDGNEINCIIFSRVGDTSIDIPNANVII
jgi:DNA excision repair protein ERCC-3